MEFILDFIFSILGELLLEWLNRLPKFIARLLLLVPLLFFGGLTGYFGYAILKNLFTGNWELGLGIGLVFFLMAAMLTYFLDLFFHVGLSNYAPNRRIYRILFTVFMVVFFLGLLAFTLVGAFDPIVWWRKIGFCVLSLLGIGYGVFNLKQQIFFKG